MYTMSPVLVMQTRFQNSLFLYVKRYLKCSHRKCIALCTVMSMTTKHLVECTGLDTKKKQEQNFLTNMECCFCSGDSFTIGMNYIYI